MKRKNIALLLIGVDRINCGGAERFFADFFSRYTIDSTRTTDLHFFTDASSVLSLKKLGKLRTDKNVVLLTNQNNRFKNLIESLDFLFQIVSKKISLVQVTSYTSSFYPRIRALKYLPAPVRPKLVVTVVDCEVPYALEAKEHPKNNSYQNKYLTLFKTLRIDAILTWYARFVKFAKNQTLFPAPPIIEAVNNRYADIEVMGYEKIIKEPRMIWAARLTAQKRPLMFLEALLILKTEGFERSNWHFELYGEGEQEEEVKSFIANNRLEDWVYAPGNQPLENVLSKSSCFISTQDYENFPSMSMMEAMHWSNAIISRNVGQTSLMVKDNLNGCLLEDDSAKGLAEKIKHLINNSRLVEEMGRQSRKLTEEVHTYPNFKNNIEFFWRKVLDPAIQST